LSACDRTSRTFTRRASLQPGGPPQRWRRVILTGDFDDTRDMCMNASSFRSSVPPSVPEADAPLMLSVSGVRGLVGRSLTPEVVSRYAAVLAGWARVQAEREGGDGGGRAVHVVLGRDSRPSGDMFARAAAAGLLAAGARVSDLGIVSTPAAAIMTRHLDAAAGLVVTASHNPIIWNGLKPLRPDGVAPRADQAQALIDAFRSGVIRYAPVEKLQTVMPRGDSIDVHLEKILPLIDADAVRAAGLKVVVDSVHGAGGPEAATLLRELGVEVIHLYAEPTGRFPHPPEPVKEHLTELAQAVRREGAAVGFAQDPDADRLALVDDTGTYIGEEYTLALCALHVLTIRLDRPPNPVAVANLSSSRMLDDVTARVAGRVVRSPVGEANVADAMMREDAAVGGEGNGGIIWPRVVHVRDSLVGMALILEMLALTRRPLSQIAADLPSYQIVKQKFDIRPGMLDGVEGRLRDALQPLRVDTQDGVRLDWEDRWVHVRSSNTEPIVRVIAEAGDETAAAKLIAAARQAIGV
jgi:phosphomannomutase